MIEQSGDSVQKLFAERFGDAFVTDKTLGRYTSARVGGSAEMLVTVRSAAELQDAIELAWQYNVPWFVLGGGSNVLIADEGMSGLVILNRAKSVRFRNTGFSIICQAESGVNLSSLTRQCINKGLGGLEWAIGVPGTIGGAVVNNSGAHGSDMSSNLVTALIWEPGVGVRMYSAAELQYEYRNSIIKRENANGRSPKVVLQADIELKPEPVKVLQGRADGFNAHRKNTQPGGATMGSMFKNPEHFYAGYLIEAAGLKGTRIGGVEVSHKHANFFVNDDNARAEDIRALLAEVFHEVFEAFQVKLEPEIELVGDWPFDVRSQAHRDENERQ